MDAKDRRIAAQDQEIADLKALVAKLESKLAKLEKNSSNSSKPPSSDIVKPPKDKDRRRKKKKIGGQKGHKQHLRTPFAPEQVDQTVELSFDACPKCGGALAPSQEPPKKHQLSIY